LTTRTQGDERPKEMKDDDDWVRYRYGYRYREVEGRTEQRT